MKKEKEKSGMERRKYKRLSEKHILRCYRATPDEVGIIEATVVDLSAGGVLFDTSVRYEVGDLLKLKITIEGLNDFLPEFYKPDEVGKHESIDVLAAVERVKTLRPASLYEIGVSFVGIDGGEQVGLRHYIDRKLKNKKK